MKTRKQGTRWMAAVVGMGLLLTAAEIGYAVTYTWDTVPATGGDTSNNWSVFANWKDDTPADPSLAYPKSAGDTAKVWNTLPSNWPGTTGDGPLHSIVIDVADINGLNLNLRDDNPPASSRIRLQVNQNATFNRIDWFNDNGGSGRSDAVIANTKTLSVNYLNITGRFPNSISGPGTLKFTPDGGGAATYGYYGSTEQLGGSIQMDHTAVTSMNYIMNGGSAYLEARDTTWLVGNASADQTWTITGGQLQLQQRGTGNPWNFFKTGTGLVDMGKRTGATPSDGVYITRGNLIANNPAGQGDLFTTSGGAGVGGTVKIAQYQWNEDCRTDFVARMMYDKVGANIVVNNSTFKLQGRDAAQHDDVNLIWLLPGYEIKTEGAVNNSNSHIIVDTTSTPLSTGRLGIYFSGASLNARGNLNVLGPRSFLNGGATGGTIRVGGNVAVQGVTNPTGFATINVPGGTDATFDDFNLMSSSLTMDGGGAAKTFQWTAGAATGSPGNLLAGNFSQADFTLDSLKLTNSTTVNWTLNSVLYLDGSTPLVIDPGSSLVAYGGPGSMIHILDPSMAYLATINTYMGDGRLSGWRLIQTSGVGYSLIPEPASLALLGLGAIALLKRRRKP